MFLERREEQDGVHSILPSDLPVVSHFCIVVGDFTKTMISVTVVGGTTGIPETGASFSGGGFSNYVRTRANCLTFHI